MTHNTPPNDVRGFLHKRIGRAAKAFVTSGFSPTAAAAGFVGGGPPKTRATRVALAAPGGGASDAGCHRDPKTQGCMPPCTTDARGLCRQTVGRGLAPRPEAAGNGCIVPGMRRDPITGNCAWFAGAQVGPDTGGAVVMGQYGAAMVPGNRPVNRAVCIRGMVVGNDGLCYNKSQVSNKQRMWPRGRRPLLTGGEMRAIAIASRAGRRMELAQKRLQKIGLMKKPPPRKALPKPTHHHHPG